MSTYPPLEARVSALERHQTIQDARMEEISKNMTTSILQLSDDMKASFQQLAGYQIKTENQLDARFNQIDAQFKQIDAQFKQVDVRFNKVETHLGKLDTRLDKVETRLDNMETLLTQ